MGKFNTQDYNYWNSQCPIYSLYSILGKKWVLVILQLVRDSHFSYSSILQKLPEISSKILSERLQVLCDEKLIEKASLQGTYTVTHKGMLIIDTLSQLGEDVMVISEKE